jgi:hypothetical protein
MNLALGGILAKVVVVLLILAVVAVATRVRFNRVLRLGPGIRTPARFRWAFLPSKAARLHHRLQVVVAVCLDAVGGKHKAPRRRARRRAPTTAEAEALSTSQQHVRSVIDEAVSIDKRLIAASKASGGTAKRQAIQAIDREVARLEGTARRLLGELRQATARAGPVAPDLVLDDRADAARVEPAEPNTEA